MRRPVVRISDSPRLIRRSLALALAVALAVVVVLITTTTGHATPLNPLAPTDPAPPVPPGAPEDGLTVEINGPNGTPSSSIVMLVGITLLSVAPALLLMMTSFTKIFVVLAMARNALGLPSIPPNQVLAGLALFLSLFIMAPVLTEVNASAVQPFLDGRIDFSAALDAASGPLRQFMLAHTREEDLALMTRAADQPNPDNAEA
ncbi:MAG TPA: flagellar type III secretion system pore protein FliP, partial [Kribbella sp.]